MTETVRRSEWCDKCRASVFHDVHPEFAVRGTVEARSDFNVDVYALIVKHPADWARIRDEERDLSEAVNTLICEMLEETGLDTFSLRGPAFFHVWDDMSEIDWDHPRDDYDFFTRLENRLIDEGLWGERDETETEIVAQPGPGQLAIDLTGSVHD